MATTAWFGESLKSTALAAQDLTTKQFYAVTVGSTGVSLVAAGGASGVKVLTNKPDIGDPAQLWDIGETKMIAGAAITVGSDLMTDSSGRFITYVNNGVNAPVGQCRSPATGAGQVFTGFIHPTPGAGAAEGAIQDSITAQADGLRAGSPTLVVGWNRVSVSAGAADSVQLPAAVPGMEVLLINDGANTVQVFGNGSDTIDAVAGATGVVLTNAKRAIFYCLTAAKWQSLMGAVSS